MSCSTVSFANDLYDRAQTGLLAGSAVPLVGGRGPSKPRPPLPPPDKDTTAQRQQDDKECVRGVQHWVDCWDNVQARDLPGAEPLGVLHTTHVEFVTLLENVHLGHDQPPLSDPQAPQLVACSGFLNVHSPHIQSLDTAATAVG